jgi:hypothetical protein
MNACQTLLALKFLFSEFSQVKTCLIFFIFYQKNPPGKTPSKGVAEIKSKKFLTSPVINFASHR